MASAIPAAEPAVVPVPLRPAPEQVQDATAAARVQKLIPIEGDDVGLPLLGNLRRVVPVVEEVVTVQRHHGLVSQYTLTPLVTSDRGLARAKPVIQQLPLGVVDYCAEGSRTLVA